MGLSHFLLLPLLRSDKPQGVGCAQTLDSRSQGPPPLSAGVFLTRPPHSGVPHVLGKAAQQGSGATLPSLHPQPLPRAAARRPPSQPPLPLARELLLGHGSRGWWAAGRQGVCPTPGLGRPRGAGGSCPHEAEVVADGSREMEGKEGGGGDAGRGVGLRRPEALTLEVPCRGH